MGATKSGFPTQSNSYARDQAYSDTKLAGTPLQLAEHNHNDFSKHTLYTSAYSPKKSTLASLAQDWAFLLDWSVIVFSIFGGCCSNAFTLESIVKYESESGLIITFTQFLLTAAITAWPQRAISGSFPWVIRKPQVPLSAWAANAILFWVVNMMNNWAFGFNISVPVHIILRSGGSITTILVGTIWGRKYTSGQILGVLLLTIGVITAAMADAQSKGKASPGSTGGTASFIQGLSILFVAQIMSAFMGLYTQAIYSQYGPYWEENLLWSHLFSLLFFVGVMPQLRVQFFRLWKSPPILDPMTASASYSLFQRLPRQIFYLALNSMTQFFCIRGVNRLAARTSALGVTVVLNLRKLISLFLSIWLFGNSLPIGVWAGAILVFSGGGVYAGWDHWKKPSRLAVDKEEKSQ